MNTPDPHSRQHLQRDAWLGRTVHVVIDRPLETRHPEDASFVYELNYGFIPGTKASDEEPIDVYIIDSEEPLAECVAEVIAVIRRRDDVEDKLVARIGHTDWTAPEIAKKVHFQERWFDTSIEM